MPSNYEQIRQENIRRYGEETRHLAFLGRLYTDRTHFIYELLQNTEDAGATRVQFSLFTDRLEVRHNGRPFDEKDVRGICGVDESTKADDLNQIGKFGIGFKSVYAYTTCPEIHSIGGPTSAEHFRIEHYVRPVQITPGNPGSEWTTLLLFPLNRQDVSTAVEEITTCLENLSVRTLLFLRKIEEIEYITVAGGSGAYIRETNVEGAARLVTVIGRNADQADTELEEEEWLVFSRAVYMPEVKGEVYVEVAYKLDGNFRSGQAVVKKITDSPLVVFFPTEKDTQLGFLIQGPYRTTPARDNVPKNNSWNARLIDETATLLAETLHELKRMKLLNLSLLQTLPINSEVFRAGTMFRPLFEAVRFVLLEKPLLPTDDGSYVPAKRAKLARGTELRRLLTREQLQQLYGSPIPFWWLAGEITLDRTPMLRTYLLEELQVEEMTPEKFAQRLEAAFLEKQDDVWMIRFYNFLTDQEALWRQASSWQTAGVLSQKPFIRLENDKLVPPYLTNKQPAVYLPGVATTDFPTIKRTLASDPRAAEFFRKLGLREANFTDEISRLVQAYQNSDQQIGIEEHKEHIRFFVNYYLESGDLTPFRGSKNCYLFCSEKRHKLLPPTTFYLDFPYRETGLSAIFSAVESLNLDWKKTAIWDGYAGIEGFADFAIALGVQHELSIDQDLTWNHPQRHEFRNRTRSSGKHAIDEDYTIKDVIPLLCAQNHAISRSIWKRMSLAVPEVLQARYRANLQDPLKIFPSSLVFALRDHAWIPDVRDNFHKPADIDVAALHPDFIYDDRNGWLTAIEFGKNAMAVKQSILMQQEHAHALGIENLEIIEIMRQIDKDPMLFEQIRAIIEANKSHPEFPNRAVNNPERRLERLFAELDDMPTKDYVHRSRSVRVSATMIDPSTSLRNQYTNDHGLMVCQICHHEMPFKKRNHEYYFEAVEILPNAYLAKEHEAQYLALCPLCAAMYKEFIKYDDEATATLWQEIVTSYEPIIPIRLGSLHATVRFVATHYHDLKAILRQEQTASFLSKQELSTSEL